MGVYIKGLEMPCNCSECLFRINIGKEPFCLFLPDPIGFLVKSNMKSEYCPLIEVETPHGRLIDENRVMKEWVLRNVTSGKTMRDFLIEAKTLIEAEEENA